MAISIPALTSELTVDPVALGFAPLVAVGDHSGLVSLLNAERSGAPAVWLDEVPAYQIRTRITLADYGVLTTANRNYLAFLLGGEAVDFSVAALRADLSAMFPQASTPTSRAAILAIVQKTPTRGEELFGVGTVITLADVAAALR